MVKNSEFYELGKLVGLREEEVAKAVPAKWVYLILVFIMIIFFIVLTIDGILAAPDYIDPYIQGTFYGTIEPRFLKRVRKKVSKRKIAP